MDIMQEPHERPALDPVDEEATPTQPIKREIGDDDDNDSDATIETLYPDETGEMQQEHSDGDESVKQEFIENDDQPEEEQGIPFALTQDEIWETAQKLKTFAPSELLKILFIADAHGQVPTSGTLQIHIFELEGDCLKEIYSFVERTWVEKLRNANLLPPLPSSDDNNEGAPQQQQEWHLEVVNPDPSDQFQIYFYI
ncbi:unnamed protein product [Orchesella dallaii]|uniref:NET domain-containing protein n=1 Tax=Orchesella dallaii TaxID=48710 RepID=A0ABP1QKA7_9HEXA